MPITSLSALSSRRPRGRPVLLSAPPSGSMGTPNPSRFMRLRLVLFFLPYKIRKSRDRIETNVTYWPQVRLLIEVSERSCVSIPSELMSTRF
jgi:hypothetical protein